jgi:hypothetical protein
LSQLSKSKKNTNMNLAMTIIIDGDIGSAFETQLRREKRK